MKFPPIRRVIPFAFFILFGCSEDSPPTPSVGYTQFESTEKQSNHIKALFFGTGPYASAGNKGCPGPAARWNSFPRGSSVEVLIPSDASDNDTEFVIEQIDRLNIALSGYFHITAAKNYNENSLTANTNQLTINLVSSNVMKEMCHNSSGGCIRINMLEDDSSYFESGNTYYPIARGIFDIHEIGHGIGLCHVDSDALAEGTMASSGDLTIRSFSQSELDAIEKVFSSGLDVGATEQEFWDAGLIP